MRDSREYDTSELSYYLDPNEDLFSIMVGGSVVFGPVPSSQVENILRVLNSIKEEAGALLTRKSIECCYSDMVGSLCMKTGNGGINTPHITLTFTGNISKRRTIYSSSFNGSVDELIKGIRDSLP